MIFPADCGQPGTPTTRSEALARCTVPQHRVPHRYCFLLLCPESRLYLLYHLSCVLIARLSPCPYSIFLFWFFRARFTLPTPPTHPRVFIFLKFSPLRPPFSPVTPLHIPFSKLYPSPPPLILSLKKFHHSPSTGDDNQHRRDMELQRLNHEPRMMLEAEAWSNLNVAGDTSDVMHEPHKHVKVRCCFRCVAVAGVVAVMKVLSCFYLQFLFSRPLVLFFFVRVLVFVSPRVFFVLCRRFTTISS